MNTINSNNKNKLSAKENIWQTLESREFIVNLIIHTLWTSTSRPINKGYNSWFETRIELIRNLFITLRKPFNKYLDPHKEEGINRLEKLFQTINTERDGSIADKVDLICYEYFKSYEREWSKLKPSLDLSINDWGNPSRIFFAFGPHIGIGDEIILSLAIESLSRKFPNAEIEIWSYSKNLWQWNPKVNAFYVSKDALAPFKKAQEIINEDPNSLICFGDYCSDKIYRFLENIPIFNRFIYIDLGESMISLVDQEKGIIRNHQNNDAPTVYDSLSWLLNQIELEFPSSFGLFPQKNKNQHNNNKKVIFLNPHSSKEMKAVSAEWWAVALNKVAESECIILKVTSGVDNENLKFTNSIISLLDSKNISAEIIPFCNLSEILMCALDSDLVFTLDTFTAHINILKQINCVTVFFGCSGNGWHTPYPSVLNLQIYDDPSIAGKLVSKLLYSKNSSDIEKILINLDSQTQKFEQIIQKKESPVLIKCDSISIIITDILLLIDNLFIIDKSLEKLFFDYPFSDIKSTFGVLGISNNQEYVNYEQLIVLNKIFTGWKNSNLCRYAKHISIQK